MVGYHKHDANGDHSTLMLASNVTANGNDAFAPDRDNVTKHADELEKQKQPAHGGMPHCGCAMLLTVVALLASLA